MEILGTYDKFDKSHENLSENTKDSEPKISESEKKRLYYHHLENYNYMIKIKTR